MRQQMPGWASRAGLVAAAVGMALFGCTSSSECTRGDCLGTSDGGRAGDAGVDAGPAAINDGGGALELVAVADENSFALAWAQLQPGAVAQWVVESENALGLRYPPAAIDSGVIVSYAEADAGPGARKTFFVVGYGADGRLAWGAPPDASVPSSGVDAGSCTSSLDCSADRVCNLSRCEALACTSSDTCPTSYECNGIMKTCVRANSPDAGIIDAGNAVAVDVRAKPFISPGVTVTTSAVVAAPAVAISSYAAKNPALVAIDSARQFIAVEQDGQLFGHLTQSRGRDFVADELAATYQIDPIGSRAKLAFNRTSSVLYACYNVGDGVRVRTSRDIGRTWAGALDLTPDSRGDGGTATRIQSCAIAPWADGHAMLVTVDGQDLVARIVDERPALLGAASTVFASGVSDGGVFRAERPAIATLPGEAVAHIAFTASRSLATGVDTEPYAVFKDATTGGQFRSAGRLNDNGITAGNVQPQDSVAVAIDPITKRAIAAFVSVESQGPLVYSTVYLSLFNSTTQKYGTGSDLSVFEMNTVKSAYIVVPDRPLNEAWDAFSPSLAVTPAGRVFLSLIAGRQDLGGGADYHAYLVPFAFEASSPTSNALGWFTAPAQRAGSARVLDPRGGDAPRPTWTALAADSQLSVYLVVLEGLGTFADLPGRALFISRP